MELAHCVIIALLVIAIVLMLMCLSMIKRVGFYLGFPSDEYCPTKLATAPYLRRGPITATPLINVEKRG